MKRQVIVIHGGATFETYKEYVLFLKNYEIDLDKLKPHNDWKDTLSQKLGGKFEVLLPRMPNSTNAKYTEWEIWFSRILSLVSNPILIGHSLGGIFLAKYLSTNTIKKKIKATILVAAPYNGATNESLTEFSINNPLSKFEKQAGKIFLIQSKDDPVVPIGEIEKYRKALPAAEVIVLKNREHFTKETFPELVKLIKSL